MNPSTARPHVVIVGGGIAGLAAAFFLRDEPVRVTVLEGSPRLGGKLTVSEVAGVPVDDLYAEPGSDVIRDRHVAVPCARRQLQVLAGPGGPFGGHHSRSGQFGQVGRHSHELAPGQRTERP